MRSVLFGLGIMATVGVIFAVAAGPKGPDQTKAEETVPAQNPEQADNANPGDPELEVVTFGSGCFWCTEAVFQEVKGVKKVVSGYSGGHVKNPTYEQVCNKRTGHAEVVQITYDPAVITFPEMLEIFWRTHDPTTPNRQGNDVGPQYRSVIFYHNPEQKKVAEEYKQKLDESGAFSRKIVTEISEYTNFYPAEDYHQDYFNLNPRQGYCQFVIAPKMEKFRKVFKDKLKED